MPKLKRNEIDLQNAEFVATIAKYLSFYGLDKRELGLKIGLSQTSVYNKIREPQKFTLEETRKIFKVLHFTNEEILKCLKVM